MLSVAPSRPVLRYHGGKWLLAPWIIAHFPPHRTYVEPFAGAASVLMQKTRTHGEVYNDLDGEVVNVFRVLQAPRKAARLRRLLALTSYSREEFDAAYQSADEPIERARRAIVRAFMGFGSASMQTAHRTGFRANATRSGTTPAIDWARWPQQIVAYVERLRGVVIENRPYDEVIAQHDTAETLFYVDPPYVHATRAQGNLSDKKHFYAHELDDDGHRRMAEVLRSVKGMVVLSGYPSELYDFELFPEPSWRRIDKRAFADGARERFERLWLNAAAMAALQHQEGIFTSIHQETP